MSYLDLGNLTPSRRAPPVPGSAGGPGSSSSPSSGGGNNSHSMYSSTSYAPSFHHNGLVGGSVGSNHITPLTLGSNGHAARAAGSFGGAGAGSSSSSPMGPSSIPAGKTNALYNTASRDSGSGMTPLRQGMVTVNEEKGIRSFLWSKKWMVLKEQTLSFHKNEVSRALNCSIRVVIRCSSGGKTSL